MLQIGDVLALSNTISQAYNKLARLSQKACKMGLEMCGNSNLCSLFYELRSNILVVSVL